ncbi:hypothetical protein BOX15_Mlig028002g1 [Macrostomum lignano]|uniref:Uncharacterized protein n=1 Tax=Macrostomum lignano TaxID=282301 RepID=A0A267H830_9PLAT|nr:hypothetical protein BOX15_Mlig028002g1 [Macrostomum lignano]
MDSEKISTFMSVTSADAERARAYLEAAQGDLDAAVAMFFAAGEESAEGQQPPPMNTSAKATAVGAAEDPRNPASRPQERQQTAASGGRFVTMDALRSRKGHGGGGGSDAEDPDSDEDDGAQAFYVGGSEKGGGQQVLGPPGSRRADAGRIATSLFASARRHGATEVGSADDPGHGAAGGFAAFAGLGLRLDAEQPAETAAAASSAASASQQQPQQPQQQPVCRVLKLWSNGVSIDAGPLRSFEEPATRELLQAVAQGRVPAELRSEARGARVDLQLEDHRGTEYQAGSGGSSKFKAFAGSGQVLGSPAPAASVQAAPTAAAADAGTGSGGAAAVPVDPSQPTTNLNVRLPSGGRPMTVTLNQARHTVADLRRFVSAERPELADRTFVFLTTFPTAEIANEEQTLEAAGLVNAAVVVRIK